MSFCRKCGKEIGNAEFCPNCGESQSSYEPKTQYTSQSPSPQTQIPFQQGMPRMMQNMPRMMRQTKPLMMVIGIICMIIMMTIMIFFVLPTLSNFWGS